MTTRGLLFLVFVYASVTGCTTQSGIRLLTPSGVRLFHSSAAYDECHGTVCNVTVTVANCRLSVEPVTFLIKGRGVESTINWHLRQPAPHSHKFVAGAIDFKGGTPTDFKDCQPKGNGQLYVCTNLHKDAGAYKYGVSVDGLCNGQPVPVLDPFVMND